MHKPAGGPETPIDPADAAEFRLDGSTDAVEIVMA